MNSVLIVSSSVKSNEVFKELLSFDTYKEIIIAKNGNEARRILIERNFDLCIINTPLVDEFGTELALNIAAKTITQIMMVVKSELADDISAKVEDYGIFVISKPFNRQIFWSALKLIKASHNKIMGLKNENIKLQKKIEDIRYIDRAKCVLIEYMKITEEEAHRFIEKQAMDMRITKREVATSILKTYEK
ncbi:MAG: ANTAR domain-containing protein [Clostridiaceae bacterium]|nr:ANTAR domain-containing protein [Clostridiaceae bacterium]